MLPSASLAFSDHERVKRMLVGAVGSIPDDRRYHCVRDRQRGARDVSNRCPQQLELCHGSQLRSSRFPS
jgi:hypothetical protein